MRPAHVSKIPRGVDLEEAYIGAELLSFDLKPQGVFIAQVAQACKKDGKPLYRQLAVQVPRRAAKTTSTTMLALGRMVSRPGYKIISTAQTGDIARRMWREVVQMLDQKYVGMEDEDRPYKARVANGTEELRWSNGSTWRPVTPSPLSYRSQAADLLIFEEAGHIAPELAADLRAGAFPTMDTRPGAQVWIIGTPGRARAGLLWDALVAGREGRSGYGLVDYTIGDDQLITNEDGTLNEKLLRKVHPGISSGLTTMEVMRERFAGMSPFDFAAEYAGQWPADGTTSAIDMEAWNAGAVPQVPLPERFGVAYDVAPDSSSAAVCAAWRDEEGVAYIGILEHRQGVSWLARTVHGIGKKHHLPIRYDGIGANHGPATEVDRMRGVKVISSPARDMQGATQALVSALADGKLRHFDQGSLTSAAEGAAWRQSEGGRYFARKASANDIAPLVAASLALWEFDQTPERRPITIRRATSA